MQPYLNGAVLLPAVSDVQGLHSIFAPACGMKAGCPNFEAGPLTILATWWGKLCTLILGLYMLSARCMVIAAIGSIAEWVRGDAQPNLVWQVVLLRGLNRRLLEQHKKKYACICNWPCKERKEGKCVDIEDAAHAILAKLSPKAEG
eukprot:scaffold66549_cov18-Tisochrysis_lutea.AAC.2